MKETTTKARATCCARCEEWLCLWGTHETWLDDSSFEPRENKSCASVRRMSGLSVVFTPPVAYKGIVIVCQRNTLICKKISLTSFWCLWPWRRLPPRRRLPSWGRRALLRAECRTAASWSWGRRAPGPWSCEANGWSGRIRLCSPKTKSVVSLARFLLIAGRMWKGDILVADMEDLEKFNASDIYPRRINAKEILIRQKDDEFIFPFADGTAKLSGRDHEFVESTQRRMPTVRIGHFSWELEGELGESQPTETTDDAEIFGRPRWLHLSSSQRTSGSTPRAERRNISYSTEIHWC